MSRLHHHLTVSRAAYNLLDDQTVFPSYSIIRLFDILNPDYLQFYRFFFLYERKNHMNCMNYQGALFQGETYYGKLIDSLKNKKSVSGIYASWLAHFIVDAIEPAHLSSSRKPDFNFFRDWREFFKNFGAHANLEKLTERLPISETEFKIFIQPLSEHLVFWRDKMSKIDFHGMDKDKYILFYQETVCPMQVQSVAGYWYNAICEADGIQPRML